MDDLLSGRAVGAGQPSTLTARPVGRVAGRMLAVGLWAAVLTGLAVYLIVYLDFATTLIGYPFDFDQGEGYDVNSGWLIAQGGWIYNDNNIFPFYSSNYPPLFSFLVAWLIPFFGVSIGLGRAVSLVAALATVGLIIAIGRRERAVWPVALAGGLLYLASPYVFHTTPLARVNALAVLLAIGAVYALGRVTPRWAAAGVVLSLLALYTKQTTIDAVAAGLLFLLWRNPRLGVSTGAAIALSGGLTFWLIDSYSGGHFWINTIEGNVNPFSWDQARTYLLDYLSIHLVLILGAFLSVFEAARTRRVTAFHIFFLLSFPFTLTAGKWGAGESYFLSNIAAACICLIWLGGVLWQGRAAWIGRLAVPVMLAAQLVLFAHGPLDDLIPGWRDRSVQSSVLGRPPTAADIDAAQRLTDAFDEQPGLVLAEENGFVLASGRQIVGNASHLRNLYLSGHWQPDNLIRAVEERRFGSVLLSGYHYPKPVMDALQEHYTSAERYTINGFGYLMLVRR